MLKKGIIAIAIVMFCLVLLYGFLIPVSNDNNLIVDKYYSAQLQALKQKLAGEMKKEFQELREAFKKKGKQKKKELELSDEEFDWN
jgi:LPS O-antigen subunit length determinant protein (WzzB/FepE family)